MSDDEMYNVDATVKNNFMHIIISGERFHDKV